MQKLRPLKPRVLLKILNSFNFIPIRKKGSHLILKSSQGTHTVIPMHSNEEIDVSLLRSILKECNISKEEFLKKLN